MKVVHNNDIVSGTETGHTKEKLDKKKVNTYLKEFKKYKNDYIKKNSLESMVYENGSALALLYKEIVRLNQLLQTNLKIKKDEK
jgi:hypothetical protein